MKPKVAFHKQKKELKSLEFLLFRSLSGDYHLDGFKQQLDVQAKIPFLDILGIHGYYLFKVCDLTSTASLPESGDSWFHSQTDLML